MTAAARYQTTQITTGSPGQILLMLYDGLFRYVTEARAALVAQDKRTAQERISRAHRILEELVAGLRPDVDTVLFEMLAPLYVYCMGRLVEGNFHSDPSACDDVIRVLSPVREAWVQVVRGG